MTNNWRGFAPDGRRAFGADKRRGFATETSRAFGADKRRGFATDNCGCLLQLSGAQRRRLSAAQPRHVSALAERGT